MPKDQELFIRNVADDFAEYSGLEDDTPEYALFSARLETRIAAYDQERKEQLERDLPSRVIHALVELW